MSLIQEIDEGTEITYGGVSWIVLEHEETGTLCLAADVVDKKAFTEEDGEQNWMESDIKSWLGETFLKQLEDAGATALIELKVDLTAVNGETDFGSDTCKVGLMSEAQLLKYQEMEESLSEERQEEVKLVPNISEKYWLCTPYSCNEFFAGAAFTHNVRVVNTNGTVAGSPGDADMLGVRPIIKIKKGTDV